MVKRDEPTPIPSTQRLELTCQQCRSFLGVVSLDYALPEGKVWIRLKCPNRRCTSWNAIDAATGKPLSGRKPPTAMIS